MPKMVESLSWGSKSLGNICRGCKLCYEGYKLIIFVTGLCNHGCFYCPISEKRSGVDLSLANERVITTEEDLLEEAYISGSKGASFTGGDPGLVPNRVLQMAALLKKEFGSNYHLHIYVRPTKSIIPQFKNWSKLIDEIRFHVWNIRELEIVDIALNYHWDVGLEIPVFPIKAQDGDLFKRTKKILLEWSQIAMNKSQQAWVNMNELEVSETNASSLRERNFESDGYRVLESSLAAESIFDWVQTSGIPLNVHYCSAKYKDNHQLPKRLIHRARKVALPFDIIQEDSGLLIRGVIRSETGKPIPLETLIKLRQKLLIHIAEEELEIDLEKGQLLINPLLIEEKEISDLIKDETPPGFILGLSEEYPTHSRTETSFVPL